MFLSIVIAQWGADLGNSEHVVETSSSCDVMLYWVVELSEFLLVIIAVDDDLFLPKSVGIITEHTMINRTQWT